MRMDPPQVDSDIESWREQVRQMPGVVVHRPQPPIPFVPDVRVINVKHMDELIGEDDDSYGEQDAKP
jgi:hypothetical protein